MAHGGELLPGDDGLLPEERTHPAIKALAAAMGLGFGGVLAWPYVADAVRSWRTPAPTDARQGQHWRGGMMHRDGRREPFRGVTTDGAVVPGLYPIRPTGASAAPAAEAAAAFLATLGPDERARVAFPVDDRKWQDWSGTMMPPRRGMSLREMSPPAREAALALVRAGMSPRGFAAVEGVRQLNHALGDSLKNPVDLDDDLYYLAVLGDPSAGGPWGWKLDGNHLAINCLVLGDQVVMTPLFLATDPAAAAQAGPEAAAVLRDELGEGGDLVRSLDDAQRRTARLDGPGGDVGMQAGPHQDNAIIPAAGIGWAALRPEQQERLLALIARYVGNLDDGHARAKMDEVRAQLDATRFAWAGRPSVEGDPDAPFYYRIQSPVLLVEFQRQAFPNPPGRGGPDGAAPQPPQHLHPHEHPHPTLSPPPPPAIYWAARPKVMALIRTPNGNDYGKELLRQHGAPHGPAQ